MGTRPRLGVRLNALCIVFVLCTACAGKLPPLDSSGPSMTLASDEAGLWEQAAREHEKLRASLSLLRDPILEDYLNDVAHRLVPPAAHEAGLFPSVSVPINPSLNAFAYPSGAIYIHSGLLARLENEAQLASVLGHEIGHIVYRHTIRYLRQERSKDLWQRVAIVTTPLVLGPLLAPLGVTVSGGVNPAVLLQRPSVEEILRDQALDTSFALVTRPSSTAHVDAMTSVYTRARPPLALLASVHGYNASLVQEADRFTVEALARAGYDPEAADRTLASLASVAKAQAEQEPFWWGQPSRYEGRRRSVRSAIAALPAGAPATHAQPSNPDLYQQRIRVLIRENAMAELKVGRTEEAIAQLGRALRLQPRDPIALYDLGKAYARKASDTDELQKAVEAYTQAIQLDAQFADAYRELALTYAKLGASERAAEAKQAYVKLRGELVDFDLPKIRAATPHEFPAPQVQSD
jgi:predicted Zn-dependent protease